MARTDKHLGLASGVGATATMVAAARARAKSQLPA
jgi:O-methyltransferase involved in polyketide biosynthesis